MKDLRNLKLIKSNTRLLKMLLTTFIILLVINNTNSQIVLENPTNIGPVFKPTTPLEFQFNQYGSKGISEYSGAPNINIPLYEINTGVINFPISLSYTSTGIKVNQEASWVGLGWDLQFGSILQVTNDKNDFYNVTYDKPDYFSHEYGLGFLPTLVLDDLNTYNTDIETDLIPFWCFYGYNWPKNGIPSNFSTMQNFPDLYDTEPDIFKANFAGHYIEFIKDPINRDHYLVLNEKNYSVNEIQVNGFIGWEIKVPDGTTYKFIEYDNIKKPNMNWVTVNNMCNSTTTEFGFINEYARLENQTEFGNGIGGGDYDPASISRIWKLTEIKDYNGRILKLNYSQNKPETYDYNNSPTWLVSKVTGSDNIGAGNFIYANGTAPGPWVVGSAGCNKMVNLTTNPILWSAIKNSEMRTVNQASNIVSIEFQEGRIDFYTSGRIDYYNSTKLDSILISNLNEKIIKKIRFYYSYFNSEYIGYGNLIPYKSLNELTKRLKLEAIKINDEPLYELIYNSTPLPPKNSFATDYWGFYNGEILNKTIFPNVNRIINLPQFYSNAVCTNISNHSAHPEYSKSCILTQIKYPTGGRTEYEWEINEFLNYYDSQKIPDFDDNTPNSNKTKTSGAGLRIKRIVDISDDFSASQETVYNYFGGKLQIPLYLVNESYESFLYTNYDFTSIRSMGYDDFTIYSCGAFSGSIQGNSGLIGYDSTTIIQSGNSDLHGKYTKHFHNYPQTTQYKQNIQNMILPSLITDYRNGMQYKEVIYDAAGKIIVQKNFEIEKVQCEIKDYGFRFRFQGVCGSLVYNTNTHSHELIGDAGRSDILAYYPIFSFKPLKTREKISNYLNLDSPLKEITWFVYDDEFQLTEKGKYLDEVYRYEILNYYYPRYANWFTELSESERSTILNLKNNQNHRHSEIIKIKKNISGKNEALIIPYKESNGLLVPSMKKVQLSDNSYENIQEFKLYDEFGNIIEYCEKNGPSNSFIWSYNKTKPITHVINATSIEMGFTSFENSELNGWTKYPHNSFSALVCFTGKSSLMVSPDHFGPFNVFSIGNNALNHSGYKASVWVKGNKGSYINIEIEGVPTTQLRGVYEFEDNQWHLIEVEYPRSKIEPYVSQGENLKVKVYVGAGSGSNATFFDDLRFCPMDAQMTTYTYEPLIGMTSISDVSNKPVYYEYDPFGRLKLVKDYLGNILKKTDYHYRDSQ